MKLLARTEFSTRLTRAREEMGLSKRALADRLEVQPSTVTHWEKGDFLPDNSKFSTICKVLRKDATFFLGSPEPLSPTAEELWEMIKKRDAKIAELESKIVALKDSRIPEDILTMLSKTSPTAHNMVRTVLAPFLPSDASRKKRG